MAVVPALLPRCRLINLIQNARYSQWTKKYKYQVNRIIPRSSTHFFQKYYRILGIPEDSDQEQIRAAYLALVKKYHPDSGSEEANADKFLEVQKSFPTATPQ